MWGGGRAAPQGVRYVPKAGAKHAAAQNPGAPPAAAGTPPILPAAAAERGHGGRAANVAALQPDDPTTLIPGLRIVHDFITKEEEEELLKAINDMAWDEDLKRKTQQYGYKFEHASQQVKAYLGPLPACFARETRRLVERGLYANEPDQMIINMYTPGQGINPHVDKTHCFDGTVGSLGLGSSCIMQFRRCAAPFELVDVWFPRRTAVVLTGDARYHWTHGIAPVTEDVWHGKSQRRKTRISMTWRRVITKDEQKQLRLGGGGSGAEAAAAGGGEY